MSLNGGFEPPALQALDAWLTVRGEGRAAGL